MAYSTISKPSLYFNTKLYTGNGGTNAITGVGFQPDWTWIKKRASGTGDHGLYDVLRGVLKRLQSNESSAEATTADSLTAFGTDGFTMGSNSSYNGSGNTYVSWNWKAGGSGSSNSDGSVSATLSASAASGFSVSTFTTPGSGTFTVGHGLGVAPKMVIYRPTGSSSWQVGHDSLGWTNFLALNNDGAGASNTAFGNTAPTTSYWTGNTANVGTNAPCVAYCFAEKKGFSKFGAYTSNANTNGPFCFTGFKPALVLVKNSSAASEWMLYDNKRDSDGNPNTKALNPNQNYAEDVNAENVDFLSNGFKVRGTGVKINNSTNLFIYWAFAAEPLVANVGASIPATAR